MVATNQKAAREKWLAHLPANVNPTKEGVRVDLAIYVYPNGQRNMYFVRLAEGKLDKGYWVGDGAKAAEAFQAVWEQATSYPK